MKRVLPIFIIVLLCGQQALCQVGQEYGSADIPPFITHLSKRGKAVLGRNGRASHNPFNLIICFRLPCRKEFKRKKRISSIFEDFARNIRKNAKKGVYKKVQPDTTRILKKEQEQIAKVEEKSNVVSPPLLKTDSLVVLNEVLFETNSYNLNNDHLPTLDSMASFLRAHPSLEARISGHTDNTGRESHNLKLSKQRAEVVAAYIIDKGIQWQRVSFEGLGSEQPIMSNDTELGRRKNRRVEILIHERR